MTGKIRKYILFVGDDPLTKMSVEILLTRNGLEVVGTDNTSLSIELIQKRKPAVVLVDIISAGMRSDKFCRILRTNKEMAHVPIISLSSLNSESEKIRTNFSETVSWLINPVNRELLLKVVRNIFNKRTMALQGFGSSQDINIRSPLFEFQKFIIFLRMQFQLSPSLAEKVESLLPSQIYSFGEEMGILSSKMSTLIAEFLKLPYWGYFSSEEILAGILSDEFCKKKMVLPLKGTASRVRFALANPFDRELIEDLRKSAGKGSPLEIGVADLDYLNVFLDKEEDGVEVVYPEGTKDYPIDKWVMRRRKGPAENDL